MKKLTFWIFFVARSQDTKHILLSSLVQNHNGLYQHYEQNTSHRNNTGCRSDRSSGFLVWNWLRPKQQRTRTTAPNCLLDVFNLTQIRRKKWKNAPAKNHHENKTSDLGKTIRQASKYLKNLKHLINSWTLVNLFLANNCTITFVDIWITWRIINY